MIKKEMIFFISIFLVSFLFGCTNTTGMVVFDREGLGCARDIEETNPVCTDFNLTINATDIMNKSVFSLPVKADNVYCNDKFLEVIPNESIIITDDYEIQRFEKLFLENSSNTCFNCISISLSDNFVKGKKTLKTNININLTNLSNHSSWFTTRVPYVLQFKNRDDSIVSSCKGYILINANGSNKTFQISEKFFNNTMPETIKWSENKTEYNTLCNIENLTYKIINNKTRVRGKIYCDMPLFKDLPEEVQEAHYEDNWGLTSHAPKWLPFVGEKDLYVELEKIGFIDVYNITSVKIELIGEDGSVLTNKTEKISFSKEKGFKEWRDFEFDINYNVQDKPFILKVWAKTLVYKTPEYSYAEIINAYEK